MSKKILSIVSVLLMLFALAACGKGTITLHVETEMVVGETYKVEYTLDKIGDDAKLTWEISNPSIAELNESQMTIKALAEGTFTLTVSADGVETSKEINVKKGEEEPVKYSITYELNGGSATGAIVQYDGTKDVTLPTPTKDGYNFLGWYESADFSGSKVEKIAAGTTGDKTFYAKWEEVTEEAYTITYELNGGKISGQATSYTGKDAVALVAPTFAGYEFAGWYESADFAGSKVEEIPAGSTGNKTFYAKWTLVEYTISYELDGGSMTGAVETYNVESEDIALPTPAKEGYEFLGWYASADFAGSKVEKVVAGSTGNKTFYAKWESTEPEDDGLYDVKYVIYGGSMVNATYTYDGSVDVAMPVVLRVGYSFKGWYDNAEFRGSKVEKIAAGETGDKTYYAKWQPSVYSIVYNLDGGELENAKTTYTIEDLVILPTPEKDGHLFLGWYDNAELEGEPVTEIAKGNTGKFEFFAAWEALEVTVVYELNGGCLPESYDEYLDGLFAEYFLAEYNAIAGTTITADSFHTSTSANIKVVFADEYFLEEFSWLFVYLEAKLREVQAENIGTSEYLDDALRDLPLLAAGDTAAILASANTRTLVRLTLHALLNEAAPDASLNDVFAKYSIDYSDPENLAEFVSTFRKNIKSVIERPLIGAAPMVPERPGYAFLGWVDVETGLFVDVITESCTLEAQWVVMVTPEDDLAAILDAADEGAVIYLAPGDYNLVSYSFDKDVTILGPNAGISGYEERLEEANVTIYSATLNANLLIDGVNLIGKDSWSTEGIKFGANAGQLYIGSCIISKYKNFIQTAAAHNAEIEGSIVLEFNKFINVGQFFVWIKAGHGAGIAKVDFYYNVTTQGDNYGMIGVNGLFSCRDENSPEFELNIVGNLFEPMNREDYAVSLIRINSGTARVIGNIFNNVEGFIAPSSTSTVVFKYNTFLDADGAVLTEAPEGANDPEVSLTDEERLENIVKYFTPLPKYYIEYDLAGGEWGDEEGVIEFEENALVTLPDPVRDGYTFLGWVDEFGDPVTEITNQDYALVATWEVVEYTIEFEANGGTLAETSMTYTVEDEVALPVPTKAGLTFAGWFDNAELTGESVKTLPAGTTGDMKLYAGWTEVTYTVNYILDGGTYDTDVTSVLPGQKIELGKATKEGYTFLGWKLFANAEEFVWDVTCQESDINLYAVFGNEGIYVGAKYDYTTLEAALAVAEDGDTIILMPGDYAGATVSKSVTIQGYNWLKNLINENALLDATVTSDIVVAADDVTIRGINLTGKGRIKTTTSASVEDLTIKYVVVRSATHNVGNYSLDAPFYLVAGAGKEIINTTIANCRIENNPDISNDRPMIAILSNVNGLTIKDNEFIGRRSQYNDGIKVLNGSESSNDATYGVKGNISITGNTFENYAQYIIWFRVYSEGNYVIENNIFRNVGTTPASHAAVNFITPTSGMGEFKLSVRYNTVENGYMLVRIDKAMTSGSIVVNYNSLINCNGDNYVKDLSGLTADYENNYWGVETPVASKFNGCSTPTNSYASADAVPSMGEIEELEYTITYDLGDGAWDKDLYTYDEIIADLLADLSAYYGTAVTPEEVHNISENASVTMHDFFLTHTTYSPKWGWLASFMIETRGKDDDQSGGVSYLNEKNNAYWRYEVWAFLNKDTRESWPYSSEYDDLEVQAALAEAALPLAESKPGPATYVPGADTSLVGAVCDGRVFLYWITQDDLILTDTIPFNVTGDLTLTAVFQDEVKATSFKVTNIPAAGIERYDTLQLEWSFNPIDTYNQALAFESTDTSVFTVSKTGLITAVDTGTATLKVTVLGNRELDCEYTIKVFVPGQFELSYKTESYVKVGDSIELVAQYHGGTTTGLTWTSLDETIATVDDSGVVTGVKAGTVQIKVALADNAEEYAEFTVTVVDSELSDILDFILRTHESNVFTKYDLNIGGTYDADILGSVNKVLFNDAFVVDTTYLEKGNAKYTEDRTMTSIEFITVHYTGNMNKTADAAANANYFVFPLDQNSTSIHYTTGNDGIFHCMDDDQRAAHAGDSSSTSGSSNLTNADGTLWEGVGAFEWLSTGVTAPAGVTPHDLLAIEVTVSDDCYYVINGSKTTIKLPETYIYGTRKSNHSYNNQGQVVNAENGSVRDAETYFNDMGFRFIVEGGEYKMAKTWWCYTQVWEGRICSVGGNSNSIGIESCVNEGSDLWYTWQKTAQLVANLMVENNLDINRVVGHHFYTAKDCPQPMLENDMQIWYEFRDLIEAEYELLTKFKDYTITFEILTGEDVAANTGRVAQGLEGAIVTYKVTVSDGTNTESIILASAVPGSYLK